MTDTYFFNKDSFLPIVYVFGMAILSVGVWVGEHMAANRSQYEANEMWRKMNWDPWREGGYTYTHFFDGGDSDIRAIPVTTSRGRTSPQLGVARKRACYRWQTWPKNLKVSRQRIRGKTIFSSNQKGYLFFTTFRPEHEICKKYFAKLDRQRPAPKPRKKEWLRNQLDPLSVYKRLWDRELKSKQGRIIRIPFATDSLQRYNLKPGTCLRFMRGSYGVVYAYKCQNGKIRRIRPSRYYRSEPAIATEAGFLRPDRKTSGSVLLKEAPLGSGACKGAYLYRPR